MIPDWMKKTEDYIPPDESGSFAVNTIKTLGHSMARIKIQKGHEKGKPLPPLVKLIITFILIIAVSVTGNTLMLMLITAGLLAYLCTWPAIDLRNIIKASLPAGIIALLILLPAMLMRPDGIRNNLLIVLKVLLSLTFVSIYNHTTQWNHITKALRQLHIPGIFIFTFDITLKYIVLLGNLISDLLTSMQLRSVGKNNRKYNSIGGVMGVAFIRGTEMNRQMDEAMQCRGFTDDYEGL